MSVAHSRAVDVVRYFIMQLCVQHRQPFARPRLMRKLLRLLECDCVCAWCERPMHKLRSIINYSFSSNLNNSHATAHAHERQHSPRTRIHAYVNARQIDFARLNFDLCRGRRIEFLFVRQ